MRSKIEEKGFQTYSKKAPIGSPTQLQKEKHAILKTSVSPTRNTPSAPKVDPKGAQKEATYQQTSIRDHIKLSSQFENDFRQQKAPQGNLDKRARRNARALF